MISTKAVRFARAMALVSQALPIPAGLATAAVATACEASPPPSSPKPPEQWVGLVAFPEPTPDAGAVQVEPRVGTYSAPTKP